MGMQHLTLHFYRQHTALDTRWQTLQSLTFLFMDTHAKLVYIFCIHSLKGDSNTEDVFKDEQASLWLTLQFTQPWNWNFIHFLNIKKCIISFGMTVEYE